MSCNHPKECKCSGHEACFYWNPPVALCSHGTTTSSCIQCDVESNAIAAKMAEPVVGIVDKSGTMKYDGGKVDLLYLVEYFPDALEAVAWVAEYGERKYARGGWRGVADAVFRYSKALLRHFWLRVRGKEYDDGDSGLAHDAQTAWNSLAVLQKRIENGEVEIRRGNEIVDGRPVLGTAQKVT